MNIFLSEFIGTMLLIMFGNGVVANVLLEKSKGKESGWIVITLGWGMAVFIGVFASQASGAHLNPAVTIADVIMNGNASKLLMYIPAQFLGAMLGTTLAWLAYKQHFDATADAGLKLACFCNSPAIRNIKYNLLTEVILSFALMFSFILLGKNQTNVTMGGVGAIPAGFIVLAVGLSFGGPTGYAANPARDLGPRIMHAILPISGKGSSDWAYSWIPVIGPIIGAALAAIISKLLPI